MEEMNQLKMFTREEANRLLPHISAIIKKLREKRDETLRLEVEVDALELIANKDAAQVSPQVSAKVQEYTRTVNQFYALIDEIHGFGCFLKDIETGLVDFYTLHQGKVVYLCWQFGEPQVSFWHEVGQGYATRAPLDPHL